MKILASIFFSLVFSIAAQAQCETWIDSPQKEDAENAHVVYRQYIKTKDYQGAFEHWQKAFEIAPAADGRRDFHYKDGVAIYEDMFKNASDDAKKAEYKQKILDLYDAGAQCISAKKILYKGCTDDACVQVKTGAWLGRKAATMYYTLLVPRAETFAVLQESVKLAGDQSSYTVMRPYADITKYLFQKEKIDKAEAREVHATLMSIADHNIANNAQLKAYYEAEKAAVLNSFSSIENYIFDCEYFVNKVKPEYDADPENVEKLEEWIRILKRQGCTAEEPLLTELEGKYAKYAAEYNAQQQAEFEAKNPQIVAKKLYDAGDYDGAISKYREAATNDSGDSEKVASYHFSIASIQFRKLNKYSQARESARTAASMRDGWGRPYMLIGDMYAKSSRSCGNDAYTRGLAVIAAIDKWSYAKSIDPEVAAEANRNIGKFSQYLPPKEDAFMQGVKAGQSAKVGCWIGETVKVRFN